MHATGHTEFFVKTETSIIVPESPGEATDQKTMADALTVMDVLDDVPREPDHAAPAPAQPAAEAEA